MMPSAFFSICGEDADVCWMRVFSLLIRSEVMAKARGMLVFSKSSPRTIWANAGAHKKILACVQDVSMAQINVYRQYPLTIPIIRPCNSDTAESSRQKEEIQNDSPLTMSVEASADILSWFARNLPDERDGIRCLEFTRTRR